MYQKRDKKDFKKALRVLVRTTYSLPAGRQANVVGCSSFHIKFRFNHFLQVLPL